MFPFDDVTMDGILRQDVLSGIAMNPNRLIAAGGKNNNTRSFCLLIFISKTPVDFHIMYTNMIHCTMIHMVY